MGAKGAQACRGREVAQLGGSQAKAPAGLWADLRSWEQHVQRFCSWRERSTFEEQRETRGVWREKRWGWTTCRPRGEGSWSPPRAIKEMLKAEFDITRLNLVGCWAFWVAKGEECFNPQRNFYQIS